MKLKSGWLKIILIAVSISAILFVTGCVSQEEGISIEDIPPTVRATIEKYAAGGKITEIVPNCAKICCND